MRELAPQRSFVGQHLGCFPAIANQVMDAFRIGIVPPFGEIPQAEIRQRSLPHERKESIHTIENMWEDIAGGDMFL